MKECLKRALRTFVQAAFGYLAANLVIVIQNINGADRLEAIDMITMLIASTVAAGLAAVMNMGKKLPAIDNSSAADLPEMTDTSESGAAEGENGSDAKEEKEEKEESLSDSSPDSEPDNSPDRTPDGTPDSAFAESETEKK